MDGDVRLQPYELIAGVNSWLDTYERALGPIRRMGGRVLLGTDRVFLGMPDNSDYSGEPLSRDAAAYVQQTIEGDEILGQIFSKNAGLDLTDDTHLTKGVKWWFFHFYSNLYTIERLIGEASQTPSHPLSYALLLHLYHEVSDSGLGNKQRHQEGTGFEYTFLGEVSRERGYGDISQETLRRFNHVGRQVMYGHLASEPGGWDLILPEELVPPNNLDKDFVPIPIIPLPSPSTEEEERAMEFFKALVVEEPQYRLIPEGNPPIAEFREDESYPY